MVLLEKMICRMHKLMLPVFPANFPTFRFDIGFAVRISVAQARGQANKRRPTAQQRRADGFDVLGGSYASKKLRVGVLEV